MSNKLIIFHYARCRKSRDGLRYLVENKLPHTVQDYMNHGLTLQDLRNILLKLNKKAHELVRTDDPLYKKELKNKQFTDDEWLTIILEQPSLLIRPIVVAKHKAVIAIPPDKIDGLL